MCGIVGLAARAPVRDDHWVAQGAEAMRHRGPDAGDTWCSDDSKVVLGHRRLSIIDLSSGGHQPMVCAAGQLAVVFNGEIYNFRELRAELSTRGHKFRSRSDTEVLLAAYVEWGTDCLNRLTGMFAFALYDGRKRSLFLARDRAGEKPLYYRVDDAGMRFGSELKALLCEPGVERAIDPLALDCYLGLGFIPGERTILRGISKLPPAHALTYSIETGVTTRWRYWQVPALDPGNECTSETALVEELDALLEAAVRRQLVADVPVGILLSGGVDSSLVTAMAARAASHVKTFTVRFPGVARYDETDRARLIARHFATEHLELEADATSADLLPLLARQFDEPMVDSSMIPTYLVSRLLREHCTVALGGDGGDELFGGYSYYQRLLWLHQHAATVPLRIRRIVASAGNVLLPQGFWGRNWIQAAGVDLSLRVPPVQGLFDAASRRRLLGDRDWQFVAEEVHDSRAPCQGDLLQRATRMDFENYLAEDILVKVDRASMLTSLEIRAPFLDHHVVEFAFGRVPSALKATPVSLKVLPKRLGRQVLPSGFDYERKWGFSIPLDNWLQKGPWADMVNEVLLDDASTVFSRDAVSGLLTGQRKGRRNGERIFALALFELWRREYGASLA